MRKELSAFVCLSLFACGGQSAALTGADDGGVATGDGASEASALWDGSFPPNEVHGDVGGLQIGTTTVFMFALGDTFPGDPTVVFSDRSVVCNPLPLNLEKNETRLTITLARRGSSIYPVPRTVDVFTMNASGSAPAGAVGQAYVQFASETCDFTNAEAIGGTLTIFDYVEGTQGQQAMFVGTFDLTFPMGHLQGSFTAVPCPISDAGPDPLACVQ